jgi:hypothetical protein
LKSVGLRSLLFIVFEYNIIRCIEFNILYIIYRIQYIVNDQAKAIKKISYSNANS